MCSSDLTEYNPSTDLLLASRCGVQNHLYKFNIQNVKLRYSGTYSTPAIHSCLDPSNKAVCTIDDMLSVLTDCITATTTSDGFLTPFGAYQKKFDTKEKIATVHVYFDGTPMQVIMATVPVALSPTSTPTPTPTPIDDARNTRNTPPVKLPTEKVN